MTAEGYTASISRPACVQDHHSRKGVRLILVTAHRDLPSLPRPTRGARSLDTVSLGACVNDVALRHQSPAFLDSRVSSKESLGTHHVGSALTARITTARSSGNRCGRRQRGVALSWCLVPPGTYLLRAFHSNHAPGLVEFGASQHRRTRCLPPRQLRDNLKRVSTYDRVFRLSASKPRCWTPFCRV